MRRVHPACCARAASGHAAAALPTSVMNVRLLIRSSDGGISRVIPLKELLHGAWLAVLIPSPSMWLALSRHLRHTGWTFGSVRYPHHRISIDSRRPAGWCMDRTTQLWCLTSESADILWTELKHELPTLGARSRHPVSRLKS